MRRGVPRSACLVALALAPAFACEKAADPPLAGVGTTSADVDGGKNTDGAAEAGPGGDCGSNPADDVCTACVKANCCNEWKTCRAEQACTTCTDCLAREQDLGSCNYTSGTCAFMSTGDATARVLLCAITPCETECGFS